ncbi:MAG: nucleotidyltransferase domain-containing protein [Bacteroidales bacterium]
MSIGNGAGMVENIADKTDFKYYGLKAMYVIGSTKEANAGPGSDIDLLIHFNGTEYQKLFKAWIDGWNYFK